MKKILITGGTGYIGSHTSIELIKQGYEVLIVDDLSNSSIKVLDKIEKLSGKRPFFKELDLKDKPKTSNFFKNNKIDAVIHFAASKAVGESVALPMKYYRNNLVSLINVIEAMSENNIHNIVFSSSATVYGQPDKLPATEDSPILPSESPYGNTKQIGEEILKDQTIANDKFNVIALRYFNPIGAHESGENGELPLGTPNNLMPFITQTAIGLRDELKVFGGDYNTHDGTAVRDYIHVVDIAKAHIKAVERMIDNKCKAQFEFFNLGTGKGFSVKEVIDAFEKSTGAKLNYSIVDRREGDVEKIYASTEKAAKELGWKAEISLDEMTLSAWKWENFLKNNK